MKFKYYVVLLVSMLVLQSCGSGGGGSDTSGLLTLSKPAVAGGTKLGDIASVTFTVSYTPPAGKVPNGVVINQKVLNSSGVVQIDQNIQLYSNTSYNSGFDVTATATEQYFVVQVSIGTMTAGSSVIIPAGT